MIKSQAADADLQETRDRDASREGERIPLAIHEIGIIKKECASGTFVSPDRVRSVRFGDLSADYVFGGRCSKGNWRKVKFTTNSRKQKAFRGL